MRQAVGQQYDQRRVNDGGATEEQHVHNEGDSEVNRKLTSWEIPRVASDHYTDRVPRA